MELEYKTLEDRYVSLPHDIKLALSSIDTSEKLQEIATKHDLLLDQASELFDLTSDVMLGLSPSKEFLKNISIRTGVDSGKAVSIADDINKEIFGPIRESLQKIQAESEANEAAEEIQIEEKKVQPPLKPLTPLEKAGDFEIIKDKPASASPQYNDTNLNKAKILDGIENPPTTPRVSIVDHLLANPVSSTNTTVAQTPKAEPTASQKSTVPTTPAAPAPVSPNPLDPYREPIE